MLRLFTTHSIIKIISIINNSSTISKSYLFIHPVIILWLSVSHTVCRITQFNRSIKWSIFQLVYHFQVFFMVQSYHLTRLTLKSSKNYCSSSTTRPLQIIHSAQRKIIVNYSLKFWNIKSSCSKISAHQNIVLPIPKKLIILKSCVLVKLTMEREGWYPLTL